MLKVTVLGNCATQTGQCECVNLVVSGNSNMLIDAGPGVVRQIYRAGLSCTDIEYVVLTHCHGDHILGYPYFLFSQMMDRLAGKTGPEKVKVVGIPQVLEGARQMLEFCYDPSHWPFEIEEIEVSPETKTELQLGDFQVTTVPVVHQVPNIGLRIEFEDRALAYSSDTLRAQPFIEVAEGVDLLLHEGMFLESMKEMSERTKHATAKDAAEVAAQCKTSRLGMVHVMAALSDNTDALVAEARQVFDGEIFVPEELAVLEV